jgi:biopolymer transport protein ExbD
MGMNVGSSSSEEDAMNSSINTTPLVDVMLVLLIIFLITIPVVTTSVKLNLPKQTLEVRESKPENLVISVDAQSRVYLYDTPIKDFEALTTRLKAEARKKDQPEVHIRGDLTANYEGVGRVILACRRAGIAKIAFLIEPPPRG